MKIIYSLLVFFIAFNANAQRICSTPPDQLQPAFQHRSSIQTSSARDTFTDEVITIPVVIHLLYNTDAQNITDAQVISQIESLNKDYRKQNNTANIPAPFASLAADIKIIFCLAKTDPDGRPTTGIIRKHTQIANWSADDQMKFSAAGGDNAWDSKRYLNIWVCNLFGRSLGYSSLPGSHADKDGLVIQYNVFGTIGNVRSPFDKGRTASHEIGHWLGLQHLWGDALCGDDNIDDTPPQRSYNNGCPSFPHTSTCSVNANGDMFMNFMDFTDDACMSMFTIGQKNKMRSMFAIGQPRNSFLNSSACNTPAPEESPVVTDTITAKQSISLYPNPARNFITIMDGNKETFTAKTIVIYNLLGREMKRGVMNTSKTTIQVSDLPGGIYVVKVGQGKDMKVLRLVKQ